LPDKGNTVVAIGNTVNNHNVWELYKKITIEQISTKKVKIMLKKPLKTLKNVKKLRTVLNNAKKFAFFKCYVK
jgi:hypothetical protein